MQAEKRQETLDQGKDRLLAILGIPPSLPSRTPTKRPRVEASEEDSSSISKKPKRRPVFVFGRPIINTTGTPAGNSIGSSPIMCDSFARLEKIKVEKNKENEM